MLKLPQFLDSQRYAPTAFTPQEISQGYNVAGRTKSMQNLNDPIGNRTRHPPARRAVSRWKAPLHIVSEKNG